MSNKTINDSPFGISAVGVSEKEWKRQAKLKSELYDKGNGSQYGGKVYTEKNTTPQQRQYIIRKYAHQYCKAFHIELRKGYDFAETITPNGTRGISIKKVK